ncbi:MAG: hypothetical protein IIA35_04720 [Proteobacteria bacterium]|nr:hypothetical protein [Pseudomonadota bacterium]
MRNETPADEEVGAEELPADPAGYVPLLEGLAVFPTEPQTPEDAQRTALYQAQTQRTQVLVETTGKTRHDAFEQLGLQATVHLNDQTDVARIAQLTQRTNQFNLTTQRYTEAEIRALGESSESDVLVMSLADRVAEIGLIGEAIVSMNGTEATIDAFLLSCRSLGRGAEKVLLSGVVDWARARGCLVLRGAYRRTKKNAQVADFYSAQGFELERDLDDGTDWTLKLDGNCASGIDDVPWIEVTIVDGEKTGKREIE